MDSTMGRGFFRGCSKRVLACSTLVLASCSSAGVPIGIATTSTGAPTTSAVATTDRVVPPSISGPHWTYAAFGDSNFYGDAEDCGGCTTFPHLLVEQIKALNGTDVVLLDATQSNFLTLTKLKQEITKNTWMDVPDRSVRVKTKTPREVISSADLITLSVGQNSMPWQNRNDLCSGVYDAKCREATIPALAADLDAILGQIVELRSGKPTAIRILTLYNDRIDDAGRWENPGLVAQGRTNLRDYIEAFNTALCNVAGDHGAQCVDIYHIFNGADGTTGMVEGYFWSPVPGANVSSDCCGDLNQRGQDEIAAALIKQGFDPLTPQ